MDLRASLAERGFAREPRKFCNRIGNRDKALANPRDRILFEFLDKPLVGECVVNRDYFRGHSTQGNTLTDTSLTV